MSTTKDLKKKFDEEVAPNHKFPDTYTLGMCRSWWIAGYSAVKEVWTVKWGDLILAVCSSREAAKKVAEKDSGEKITAWDEYEIGSTWSGYLIQRHEVDKYK